MSKYEWEQAGKHNPWGKKRIRGSHCNKGHEFTEANTFIRKYDNARVCRECRKQYAREKYQRNKIKNNGVARPKKDKPQVFDISEGIILDEVSSELYQQLQDAVREDQPNCAVDLTFYIDTPEKVTVEQAEEMCYNCPMLKLCYDFAVASKKEWGVWGGINFTTKEMMYEID